MGELGVIGEVISSNKGKVNLHELEQRFGSRLTSKMLRKYEISNHKFLRKFAALQKRYHRNERPHPAGQWAENERKLFIWFSILFCNRTLKNYDELTPQDWATLSQVFFHKDPLLLKYETHQIQKSGSRVHWGRKEESILQAAVSEGKLGQWNEISRRLFFETGGKHYKTSKQCREHWFNHLDKNKRKGEWSKSEDLVLVRTVLEQGRKWSTISHLLSDQRTEHMAKNRYHSLLNAAMRSDLPDQDETDVLKRIIQELEKEIQNGAEEQMVEREGQKSEQKEDGEQQNSENGQDENKGKGDEKEEECRQQQGESSESEGEAKDVVEAEIKVNGQQEGNAGWGQGEVQVSSPYFFMVSPFAYSPTVSSPYFPDCFTWNSWPYTSTSFCAPTATAPFYGPSPVKQEEPL